MTQSTPGFVRDATTIEGSDAVPASETSGASSILLVITTAEGPRAYAVQPGCTLTLGRGPQADVVVADPSLSRLHARFTRTGDRLQVDDLASRNGTWLLGQRVEQATLRVGSTLILGSVSATIQAAPPAQLASLGLMSTASMLELVEDECARSRIFGRPLSLMLVKSPAALSTHCLALRCLPKLRETARIAPYERQSLLVLLPETDAAAALREAKLLAQDSLWCAVASLPEAGPGARQLLAAGMRALERCKRTEPCVSASRAECNHVDVSALSDEQPTPRSAATIELQRMIARLATRDISVLVMGETGSGKELVAQALHRGSPRRAAPLKIVNCAAIPESLIESVLFGHVRGAFTGADRDRPGVFAQAHGGTLFLDEVGELSAGAQAALLRALDTRRICPVGGDRELVVDVRVVAATHRDLASMAESGQFRLDLFHRLDSVTLHVPALRERPEEIEGLAKLFIDQLHDAGAARPSLSARALERLQAYRWPGNVRELRNVIERALALSDGSSLCVDSLPPRLQAAADSHTPPVATQEDLALRASLQSHELAIIREALRRSRGNQRRAAGLLQLPLRTLERKLQLLGSRIHVS